MTKLNLKLVVPALALIFTIGCSDKDSERRTPKALPQQLEQVVGLVFNSDLKYQNQIKVTDSFGSPISGAQILIGQSADQPFIGNFITTDENGVVAVPAEWNNAQSVTINAQGYVRRTYLNQSPSGQQFSLNKKSVTEKPELNGITTGYNIKDKDGIVDAALVVPAFTKQNLFNFSIDTFVSPVSDTMTVVGRTVEIPSNISLPKQKESYFLPVTLDKPKYRMFFNDFGPQTVVAIKAQLPLRKMVDDFQNKKPFYEMVNNMSIQGGAIRKVNLQSATQTLDIPVNELLFNQPRSMKAPQFAADQYLMTVSVSEYDSEFVPTDIKNVLPGTVNKLNLPINAKASLLAVMMPKDQKIVGQLSANLANFTEGYEPSLLSYISKPTVTNVTNVKVETALSLPVGLENLGTIARLSQISKNGKVEVSTPIWEVYSTESWINQFDVPAWPSEAIPVAGSKRWEVAFVAGTDNQVTHLTHNQTDF